MSFSSKQKVIAHCVTKVYGRASILYHKGYYINSYLPSHYVKELLTYFAFLMIMIVEMAEFL